MALKEEHFVSVHIDWNNKVDNIREMAVELNIGFDSLVFIDDSPAERELVKKYLPEVSVPDFPEQPYMLPGFFRKIVEQYFAIYTLTEEDQVKTKQYQANTLRTNEQYSFANMEEYIRSLEIVLKIAEVNDLTLTRAAQMTQKTNQFNLTTRRYTDSDLKTMLLNGNKIYTLSVSDKFGDNGITGLCVIKTSEYGAEIDSFLLSCRILGKNIEKAFIAYIFQTLKTRGIIEVRASYIPSAKNVQVKDFYEKTGFHVEKEDETHTKYYYLRLSDTEIQVPMEYTFI
jgi:FkbH-like protein